MPEIESLARFYLPSAACHAPLEMRDASFAHGWAEMEAGSKCLGLSLLEISAERERALQTCTLVACASRWTAIGSPWLSIRKRFLLVDVEALYQCA